MANYNILVLIPARFDSTRFPGKPLALIHDRPMIQWVFERVNASKAENINFETCVVTDHQKVKKEVDAFGGNVCLVEDVTESGTERIALALERHFQGKKFDLVINVQGDEPLIKPTIIEKIARFHLASEFDIATVVRPEDGIGDEPNTVKAIYCPSNGRCLYFSRAAVPFDRNKRREHYFAHVGIYSFKPEALTTFCQYPVGYYENIESLEQLRALENGLTIGAIEVDERLQGVDVPEDIEKVEEKIK